MLLFVVCTKTCTLSKVAELKAAWAGTKAAEPRPPTSKNPSNRVAIESFILFISNYLS